MDNTTKNLPDIMQYESDIWKIADLLIAASVKQSDFPAYMMPFFALMMLEGRMRNAVAKIEKEYGLTAESQPEEFKGVFQTLGCGFNKYIVLEGKTLKKICQNDTSFESDFDKYLKAFDADLKELLGVGRGPKQQKFLNMDGIVAELKGKGILLTVASEWSQIDLSGYDNSAITTLEEHIKRRWADISASTAGEQYTPDDIISLMAEIVADKIRKPRKEFVHVYDPTCGGANLLFGVADRLRTQDGYKLVATYGSEYNDALYALAAIESRFREHSQIEYGNTLTKVPFAGTHFDAIVANPPYGTPWKGYADDIKNDQKGQFEGGLPSTGDGQFLFMQHILWQLDKKGLAVVVADGSTLFSGDAGSGECNIRKYVFDHDWVEAIIQMPQQEFFNTGITTYLWILNKDKEKAREDKIALIDASKGWVQLKKSKGDKRREMTEDNRQLIVSALHEFKPNKVCKIFDREYFYYNKQKVLLTELDDNGKAIESPVIVGIPTEIEIGDRKLSEFYNLGSDEAKALLAELKSFDYRENQMVITGPDGKRYEYDNALQSILVDETPVGRGVFSFSVGTQNRRKFIRVVIDKEISTDYEIIPHHFDEKSNDREIAAFVKKYIFKPCEIGENRVGVELNFNKEFYVPEKLEPVKDILAEIATLDKQLSGVKL